MNSPHTSTKHPWQMIEPLIKPLSECCKDKERHISRCAARITLGDHSCMLFGCTQDTTCTNHEKHLSELDVNPFVRQLCSHCCIPICFDCEVKLRKHDGQSLIHDGGTISMSLSNDHYYGHVNRFIVDNQVTWLECSASCIVWSTMLVYYLESPYGHLMKETMGNPQGRTHVKGNLFSFTMHWEDIGKMLFSSMQACKGATSFRNPKIRRNFRFTTFGGYFGSSRQCFHSWR